MTEPDPFKISEAVIDLWRDYIIERDKAKELEAENARLKAKVELLTDAGDAMAAVITQYRCSPWGQKVPTAFTVWQAWFDAKEGKCNE